MLSMEMIENHLEPVERTRKGYPALWVGGGATSHKFECNIVLRDNLLAPALFIRTSGQLSNGNQALVGLKIGDIIIRIAGNLPATPDNPDVSISAIRVINFVDYEGELCAKYQVIDYDIDNIPASVWEGCNIYHNREGRYFVADK